MDMFFVKKPSPGRPWPKCGEGWGNLLNVVQSLQKNGHVLVKWTIFCKNNRELYNVIYKYLKSSYLSTDVSIKHILTTFLLLIFINQHLKNSASRLFADNTKVSAKIKLQEDTERLQQDLNKIYTWADENLMIFNENKFEQMSHADTKNVGKGIYRTKSGQIIEEKKQ